MRLTRRGLLTGLTTLNAMSATAFAVAAAPTSDPEADRAADAALRKLIAKSGSAEGEREGGRRLDISQIVKVGFLLGGAYGEGALRQGDKTVGYYNSAAASYGLQAGVQWFGYALFFMNEGALKYFESSQGFEIGVGPSVVVVDQGLANKFSSTTLTQDVYAFIFGQNGLMAGLGIEGTKITKI
jgi:lipid-binding SYLF domain-containing protein